LFWPQKQQHFCPLKIFQAKTASGIKLNKIHRKTLSHIGLIGCRTKNKLSFFRQEISFFKRVAMWGKLKKSHPLLSVQQFFYFPPMSKWKPKLLLSQAALTHVVIFGLFFENSKILVTVMVLQRQFALDFVTSFSVLSPRIKQKFLFIVY
jgi:hypothetical protein